MAANHCDQQNARLASCRWLTAGTLSTLLIWGGGMEAIAANGRDQANHATTTADWQLANTDYGQTHRATTERSLSPTATEATSPTTGQVPSSATDSAAPTLEITPDPNFTAPLPARQPLPEPGVDPVVDSLLGRPQEPDFDTYRLGPGDAFFVNVRQFPDLSFQATLDIQGNVIVPLQGVVSFNGLTLDQSAALITDIFNQYVINPDVSLTLVAQRGVEVTILGEVVRPGYYPLGAPQIASALLTAGGTTNTADLRSVIVQRRLPDGQLLERNLDLFTPLKDGDALPNIALQDGDVIFVERLDPAALDEYDQALVARSTLATPTITVRLLNYGPNGGILSAVDLPNGSRFADALVRTGVNADASNLGEIALVRFDETAGRAVTTLIDGHDAFRGIPAENPPLQQNDVIIVNRSLLARVSYALNTFTQPFRDVLGFLLFFDSLSDSATNLFQP
ncbi:polysaccharide biosynthesis/export family protein [Leptolyngbya iicbica]